MYYYYLGGASIVFLGGRQGITAPVIQQQQKYSNSEATFVFTEQKLAMFAGTGIVDDDG